MAQPVGWLYNHLISVSNPNTQNGVDYQLKITVNTQSIIASGHMLPNGNDIRFGGTCTGNTFYNYWIESGINTPTTTIWIKVPLIPSTGTVNLFMFYGNPNATAASTIQGTFRGPNSSTDSVTGGASGGLLVCQRGFRFAPTQNLLVTHFGKNEPTGSTRFVTIFNYTSQAIVSQTVVSGQAGTYTYGPIASPIWLNSGSQYVLQIYGTASDGYYYGTSSQIGQHLTYFDMQYSNGGTQNTFPNATLANYHYGYGDFLYYITNTLAITPTYTFEPSLGTISTSSNVMCNGNSATLTANVPGTYTWNTGSTASVIVVTPTITSTYFLTTPTNSFMCPAITLTVSGGLPVISVVSSTNQTCLGKTATLTASGALTYTWTNGVSNGVSFFPQTTTTYTVSGENGCGITTAVSTISVNPLPINVVSTHTAVCANKTATLSATAVATSYTWNPGNIVNTSSTLIVSPQANTVYTISASDGTCSGMTNIALQSDPVPTIVASANSSVICPGGSISLSVTGGNNYTWTPGNLNGASLVVNPTVSTLYDVVGDNNFGCLGNSSQVIVLGVPPSVAVTSNAYTICNGSSSTITASGANNYIWTNGPTTDSFVVTPNVTTIYTVDASDNNNPCNITSTIEITVITPTISITGNTIICSGDLANLIASGATSYTWAHSPTFQSASTNVTPTSNTIYTVNATSFENNLNCPVTGIIEVTVHPKPSLLVVATRTALCAKETNTITASGAATFSWVSTNTTLVASSITLAASSATILTYTLTGESTQGCKTSTTVVQNISPCNSISELQNGNMLIMIYPNPNQGEFIIQAEKEMHLNLINQLGQHIKHIELNEKNNFSVSVLNLANGVYFITGQNINQKIMVSK